MQRRHSRRAFFAAGGAVALASCGDEAPGPPPAAPPIELWFGGDVHFGQTPRAGLFDDLLPLIAGAVGIVNLEGPVGAGGPVDPSAVVLSNALSGLSMLEMAGVRVVGIANNHALDGGPDGIPATAEALRQAKLLPSGYTSGPAILAFGARRVVVTAHDLGAGVPSGLRADLLAARAEAGDLLVATFHVTGPPSYLPGPELRQAAEIALDTGARVVASHGSHALGPVERRGEAVIAWGLGNLLFACDCTEEVDGAILRVSIDESALRAEIIPIDAGLRGAPARPSHDAPLILDLLHAIGSSPLTPSMKGASF